jgi:hypothetical protein
VRSLVARVVQAHLRKACIVAVGEWGGKKCLLKNRDRNYTPEVKLYHKLINGIEVLYMKDEVTGWCEGLNEHGIGIVNAALAVAADEKQGKAGKGKSTDAMSEATLRDGKRVLKALGCADLDEAVEVIKTHLGGLRGHTFVANKDKTYSLEATWRGHDYHQRTLPGNRKHVRTNHGIYYQDAGYTEKDGENYLSSLARRDQAMKELRKVDGPDGIAPAIYGKRKPELSNPLNMVKLTNGMRTTSQMVVNLDDLQVNLYLIPSQIVYLGYENKLPKKHKPKISVQVREYTDIDGDGKFDIVEVVLDKPRGKKEPT